MPEICWVRTGSLNLGCGQGVVTGYCEKQRPCPDHDKEMQGDAKSSRFLNIFHSYHYRLRFRCFVCGMTGPVSEDANVPGAMRRVSPQRAQWPSMLGSFVCADVPACSYRFAVRVDHRLSERRHVPRL